MATPEKSQVAISVYDFSIPVFTRGLKVLSHILTQASQHAASSSVNADETYPPARLCSDMLPLTFQVLTATNTAKKSIMRLTGKEMPVWEDDEKTIEQLQARLKKSLELLESQKREEYSEAHSAIINMEFPAKVKMNGLEYVTQYALPNFFFHVQTAYAILRSQGVPLGKRDYLESFMADKVVDNA